MSVKRKVYSLEEKRAAWKLVGEIGLSGAARRLDINPGTLRKWNSLEAALEDNGFKVPVAKDASEVTPQEGVPGLGRYGTDKNGTLVQIMGVDASGKVIEETVPAPATPILKDNKPFDERLMKFSTLAAMAKRAGQDWLEVEKDIINYFNPHGLGGAEYFIYEGVRVCETGMSEKLEDDLQKPLAGNVYGDKLGRRIN